jgi:hypothetical protein
MASRCFRGRSKEDGRGVLGVFKGMVDLKNKLGFHADSAMDGGGGIGLGQVTG